MGALADPFGKYINAIIYLVDNSIHYQSTGASSAQNVAGVSTITLLHSVEQYFLIEALFSCTKFTIHYNLTIYFPLTKHTSQQNLLK